MIGGIDKIFRSAFPPKEAMEAATRAVLARWPAAVLQSGTTGAVYSNAASVPFSDSPEILIYRNRNALETWETLGADPSNVNTMIHLLAYDPGQLTVVVDDDADASVVEMLDAVRDAVAPRAGSTAA